MSSRTSVPEPRWLYNGPPEVRPEVWAAWCEELAEAHRQAGAEVWDAWHRLALLVQERGYTLRTDTQIHAAVKALEAMFEAEAADIEEYRRPTRRQVVECLRTRWRVFGSAGAEKEL